jgi:error-prone DNA polymerase
LRPPLCSVEKLSKETAKEVVLERLQGGRFTSLQDVVDRTTLERDVLETLARGGAFDTFTERPQALYDIAPLVRSRQPKQTRLITVKDYPLFPELGAMGKIEGEQNRNTLRDARVMMTEGSLQRRDLAWTLRAERVWSVAN